MRLSSRSLFVVALCTLVLAACGKKTDPVTADDKTLGNPAAMVTVIEYASVACPHCAKFNNEVFPAFKAKYIDTNKIHYVFREMLVGSEAETSTAAAGFLMARCAGKDKYFSVVDAIFHAQADMFASGDVRGSLLRIAQSAGLTEAQFNACINDDAALKALNDRVQNYVNKDGVDSTPTFVVNGKRLVGDQTLAQLDTAIAAAQTAN
jgi:protein-disulfide isomerase